MTAYLQLFHGAGTESRVIAFASDGGEISPDGYVAIAQDYQHAAAAVLRLVAITSQDALDVEYDSTIENARIGAEACLRIAMALLEVAQCDRAEGVVDP